jgi:hypothetical protein
MVTTKMIMFAFMFALTTYSAIYYNMSLVNKTTLNKKTIEANAYNKAVQEVVESRGTYLKIYGSYPSSISVLVSKGLLPANFSTSEYGKDITLNSDGSISIANRDVGNELKNQLLVANQENLLSQKNIDNTMGLIEQKKRFNNLNNNEKSIELGNDVSLSKNSSSYSQPSLSSANTITDSSTSNLRGW